MLPSGRARYPLMSVPPESNFTVSVCKPPAPSGTVSGLLALGTAVVFPELAEAVAVGIGSPVFGTSSGVQPTKVIAAAAAVILPMMNATRLVKVPWDMSPER
ncbi:hypothetical protein StoSoilA2_25970 [Arthrobacter sp. StoSoilA2]|nr:hypothetical protein StoSoilA2_25970 [Arthrobacter sp. StoSoilA2]